MCSRQVHYASGIILAAGIAYGGLVNQLPLDLLICAVFGAIAGSSAPDWLEISGWYFNRRVSVIPHRTITHWMFAWFVAVVVCIDRAANDFSLGWAFASGFAASGLLHVLLDAGTPMGVPVIFPFRRRRNR